MIKTSNTSSATFGGQGTIQHHIQYVDPNTLKPNSRNARRHSKKQLKLICKSIEAFGFNAPILVDTHNQIVAGHGRWEAALLMGVKTVPIVHLHHLTEGAKRAYMLADNKIAELSTFDQKAVGLEIQAILELDSQLDLGATGFETAEIDLAIQAAEEPPPKPDEADEIINPPPRPVTRVGDVWLIGDHRLICADATKAESYASLLGEERVRLVVTDPPYNVAISSIVGLGKVQHREFVQASGEMTEQEFTTFLTICLGHMANALVPGGLAFTFMDWRHLYELLTAGRATFTELKNIIVWSKTNAGMGAFYRSQHELIPVWKRGSAPHINTFRLGKRRYRTNVWTYPGVNTFKPGRDEELESHPTVKPVAMIADIMLDCSNRGDLVLDPFVGSGTVFLAAERTGRRARGMELDPGYCDVAVQRWQKLTGQQAVLAATGQTFAEVAEVRHV